MEVNARPFESKSPPLEAWEDRQKPLVRVSEQQHVVSHTSMWAPRHLDVAGDRAKVQLADCGWPSLAVLGLDSASPL